MRTDIIEGLKRGLIGQGGRGEELGAGGHQTRYYRHTCL